MSRGPISIFGPIFKVGSRSEDPDLRIAEGSWCPGGGRKKKYQGVFVLRPFFRPRRWKMGDSSFFVPRRWEMGDSSFFGGRNPTPPSSVRPSTHSSGPKIEDGGSSIFGCDMSMARRILRRSGLSTDEQRQVLSSCGHTYDIGKIKDALHLTFGDAQG